MITALCAIVISDNIMTRNTWYLEPNEHCRKISRQLTACQTESCSININTEVISADETESVYVSSESTEARLITGAGIIGRL